LVVRAGFDPATFTL